MAHCDAQQLTRLPTTLESGGSIRLKRVSQTIPPATRRAVLHRDKHRCQAPGCRHATFVDVHHLRAREDGGGHELENLLTLCIERDDSGDFRFRHADGTPYGEPHFGATEVAARAFRALRKLGFGEREVRNAIELASAQVGEDALRGGCAHVGQQALDHDCVERLIRSALEPLTRDTFAKAC